MKNLKLKLTMIVTVITILMMNVVVLATTDMTANVEGKEVVVSVKIESNIEEAIFALGYNDNLYNFIESSVEEEYLNAKNGKVKVSLSEADLKASNYVVTFKFEYIGEDKTNTSAFTLFDIDFTNKAGEAVEESPISRNVEINIQEQEKPEEPVTPTQPTKPEEPAQPTEQEKPTIPTDSKEQTKQENLTSPTEGEVGLSDEKPQTLPQAGSLTVLYVAGSFVILMIAGLVIINNKRK